ncbi:MAG TPA: ABC transporter permease [Stellaceae bacterium]|nr:ABC transporter permease [Stellaceae bacterium]
MTESGMTDLGMTDTGTRRAVRAFSPARVYAMVLRYVYLLRGSWPRILELIYWPTIQMIIWGFTSQFMATNSSWVGQAFGVLLGAVLLWDVFFRGQLGVSISFLEELWSRNLGHLFVSPLRPLEWAVSLLVMSFIRVMIAMLPAALLAIPMFGYSVFTLGLPLAAFVANLLVASWAVGMAIGAMLLLNGLGAEGLAWLAVFILSPVSAVYYPVSVLPGWLQVVAFALPTSHVFEGMRKVMFDHVFSWSEMAWATGLNVVYMALGAAFFLWAFHRARIRGSILQTGE